MITSCYITCVPANVNVIVGEGIGVKLCVSELIIGTQRIHYI